MDVFVARQPILDVERRVVAYELLYRSSATNRFPGVDGTLAATAVIDQTMGLFGLDKLVPNARAYINVTRRVLVEGLYELLPPDRVMLEILESVEADPETLAACDAARRRGYALALDDYAFDERQQAFIEKVSVVKVDWPSINKDTLVEQLKPLQAGHVRLLAEKVETPEDVALAELAGFSLFQGFFFFRPEMVQARDIPASKLNSLQLLNVVSQPVFNLADVEALLQRDIALSVRLLRYLNSAAFSLRSHVMSLHQALVFLGERPLRCWLSVAALSAMGADRPAEILTTCLVRARCCELLAKSFRRPVGVDTFLMGMLSLVDVLLGRPLPEILEQTGVSKELKDALLRRQGPAGDVYQLALDLERGSFEDASARGAQQGLTDEQLVESYTDAVVWADQVMRTW